MITLSWFDAGAIEAERACNYSVIKAEAGKGACNYGVIKIQIDYVQPSTTYFLIL